MQIPKGFAQATSAIEDDRLYSDHVVPAKFTNQERRFRTLFADTFSHHVRIEATNRSAGELRFLLKDTKRLVEQDDVTSLFREQFLTEFRISRTSNEDPHDIEEHLLDNWQELLEMTDPAVAFPFRNIEHGNNRLCLLLGDAGQGKSLLLSKILSECLRQRKGTQAEPVVVYLNMEGTWKKEDGTFKDIDNTFWEILFTRLRESCIESGVKSNILNRIESEIKNLINGFELGIRKLCRELPKEGKYAIFAIDNIDRFHFSEMRYSFFEEYKSRQVTSIESNICALISKFSDLDGLGKISSSVILVCRKPVYDHLLMTTDGSSPTDSHLKDYTVYQLISPTAAELLLPRLKLFTHLIEKISSNSELKLVMGDTDDLVRGQLAFNRAVTRRDLNNNDGLSDDIFELLLSLSHQGARGLIQFLSEFDLDCRANGEAIERVFARQPRNLLRLFITNRRKRYSQARQHFPNMFLNDCMVDPDPQYPVAHATHKQSYWLKWLILKLIHTSPGEKISFESLHKILVHTEGYDDHLVRLAIGSLSTPNTFGCISVRYRNHSIESRLLSLTRRGYMLVDQSASKALAGIPFCFGFDYLQLVIDDPWLTYPSDWADVIVPSEVSIGYTLRDANKYFEESKKYLDRKTSAVLIFFRVLVTSWHREEKRLINLTEIQRKNVTPNFDLIADKLFQSFRAILTHYETDGKKILDRLRTEWDDLQRESELPNFWENID
jgi:hypothetical protein